MPELPEVQTIVSELNYKLKNKTIKTVLVNAPKMVSVGPAALPPKRKINNNQVKQFIRLLAGQKILSVKRRAKLLLFNFSGPWSMLVHLKMTGQFIYETKQLRQKTKGRYRLINKQNASLEKLPSKHTHVIFNFTDGSILYFNDVRKFGYLKLVHHNEINQVKDLREFGPEPLSPAFTAKVLEEALLRYPARKIKQALTDPKLIAGIGNIYSDEILFHSQLRPTRKVASIKPQEFRVIYNSIIKVLKKGIAAKGSSVGEFVRTDGSWGQMGKFHFVYGRAGQKCKVCGTTIQSVKMNGRTGSYCPRCQK
jgi:formamidopyrimidine-DNA glycosylase